MKAFCFAFVYQDSERTRDNLCRCDDITLGISVLITEGVLAVFVCVVNNDIVVIGSRCYIQ